MSGGEGGARLLALLAENPDIERIELIAPDMNGVMRGKWLPVEDARKAASGAVRLPLSTYNLDIFSQDVAESAIAIETGDPDGALLLAPAAMGRALWADRPTLSALTTMVDGEGGPNPYDPRAVLARVAARFAERGLRPVIAPELEFYLVDAETDAGGRVQPPMGPGAERLGAAQIYMLDVQAAFGEVLDEIGAASAALGAACGAATAEYGPGQFEINLRHVEGALEAADAATMLKRAVRGVARKAGYEACFMPKPYGDHSGSGLHVHMSVLDADGRNIFDAGAGAETPNAALSGALGGLIRTMPEATLLFAPHLNSYRRLRPGSFAPAVAAWGLDNRGAAIRCPSIEGPAARFEHRVAGADANPHLVLAAVLAGVLRGMDEGLDPGAPVIGEPKGEDGAPLPTDWSAAISAFEASEVLADAFGAEFHRCYAAMKRQELDTLLGRVTDVEFETYLRTL